MHYKVVLFLSGAFILLMAFTIFEQIYSFVSKKKNPVSSINVHQNENGFHESSVVALSSFIISAAGNSTIELAFSNFNIQQSCACLNSTQTEQYQWKNCSRIITFYSRQVHSNAIFFEAPVNWKDRQTIALICDHSPDQIVAFIFVILTESFDSIKRNWDGMKSVLEKTQFIDFYFEQHIQSWIHCNFYTKVMMSRTEYFRQHKLDKAQIDSTSSTTANVRKGQTRMNFMWRDGNVTRIDKFNEYSIWSFAMLLCAVLLGLERCYAILGRARAQHRKHNLKSWKEAKTPC